MPRTTRAEKEAAYKALRTTYDARVESLGKQVFDGAISVDAYESAMREQIKTLHVQAYSAGRSGNWADISFAEWGSVGNRLRTQYAYLSGFTNTLRMGNMSLKQINARAKLYGAASTASFEAAIAAEKGVDASVLPAWPGDGTTLCRVNCKCRWAIRKRNLVYKCTWRLGKAEHCTTCLARARSWKNLEIRNGVLVTQYEPIFE